MIRLQNPRHSPRDSIVPMINVAFLLLIFFLMTAVLEPPDPVDATPPVSEAEMGDTFPDVLVVTREGEMAFGPYRGDAVFDALSPGPLRLRADAGLEAAQLAKLIGRLAEAGMAPIELVTVPR
jgi:biopolymer transport protein ExbD